MANPTETLSLLVHPLDFILVSKDNHCRAECYGYEGNHGDNDFYDAFYSPHAQSEVYLVQGLFAERIRKNLELGVEQPIEYVVKTTYNYLYKEDIKEYVFIFELKTGSYLKAFTSRSPWLIESKAEGLVQLFQWLEEMELGKEAYLVAEVLGAYIPFREIALKYYKGIQDIS